MTASTDLVVEGTYMEALGLVAMLQQSSPGGGGARRGMLTVDLVLLGTKDGS